MPAFGINTGSIALEAYNSFNDGYDRQKTLQKNKRAAAIENNQIRRGELENEILDKEQADRLAAIQLENEQRKAQTDRTNQLTPKEVEGVSLDNAGKAQTQGIKQEQRGANLESLRLRNKAAAQAYDFNKNANPMRLEGLALDNDGKVVRTDSVRIDNLQAIKTNPDKARAISADADRAELANDITSSERAIRQELLYLNAAGQVIDQRGKVIANNMDALELTEATRQDKIDSATFSDRKAEAQATASNEALTAQNRNNNIATELSANNAEERERLAQAEAGTATAQTETIVAEETRAAAESMRKRIRNAKEFEIVANEHTQSNNAFAAELLADENAGRDIGQERQEARFKRMASTLLLVKEADDGTEAGKDRALNLLRNSSLFDNPDLADFDIDEDGVITGYTADGAIFEDKNGFDNKGNPDRFQFNLSNMNEDLLPYAYQPSEVEKAQQKKGSANATVDPVKMVESLNKYQGEAWKAIGEDQAARYGIEYDSEAKRYLFSPAQTRESREIASRTSMLMQENQLSWPQARAIASEFTEEYSELAQYGISRSAVQEEYEIQLDNVDGDITRAPSFMDIINATLQLKRGQAEAQARAADEQARSAQEQAKNPAPPVVQAPAVPAFQTPPPNVQRSGRGSGNNQVLQ